MIHRTYWKKLIEKLWNQHPVLWLSGVSQAGKTLLCRSLDDIEYFDCEAPETMKMLGEPDRFIERYRGKRLALDDIGCLGKCSELIDITSRHYSDTRIIATARTSANPPALGPETASTHKGEIWLTPMLTDDQADFGNRDINVRMLNGGLPSFFLSEKPAGVGFSSWIESFISDSAAAHELQKAEKPGSLTSFIEMLFRSSGDVFESADYSRECAASRTTINSYLYLLERSGLAYPVRSFSSYKPDEITSSPRVYAFDTGFVCHYKGWSELTDEMKPLLWEHIVLNELIGRLQSRQFFYWRDRRGHRIDIVSAKRGIPPLAVICALHSEGADLESLFAFGRAYPDSTLAVVSSDISKPYRRISGSFNICMDNLESLISRLS
jgi:predicted AAA+ superfamily ATPase